MLKPLLLAGSLLATLNATCGNAFTTTTTIETHDCKQMMSLHKGDYTHICGYLVAPENYDVPASKQIKIPFLIIQPLEIDESLNPVLVTGGGGPGNALLKSHSKYGLKEFNFSDYFTFSVETNRQLIILENRGVGLSAPSLNCPQIENQTIALYKLEIDDYLDTYKTMTKECLQSIKTEAVDITQYNVENAAKDIESLRLQLLESELSPSNKLNLYGISYGTRVALYYEMLFSNSTRTMILDSVALQQINPITMDMLTTQNAFDLLFENCYNDDVCKSTYGPKLETKFYAYLEQLHNKASQIEVVHPYTHKSEHLVLDTSTFIYLLFSNMYSHYDYANLPYILSTAINGSHTELSKLYTTLLDGEMNSSLEELAYYSYLCFDNSYEGTKEFQNLTSNYKRYPLLDYYYSHSSVSWMEEMCDVLGMETDDSYPTSKHSITTPVLLLSGKLDPVTPPANADVVEQRANTAWDIEWDNVSHDVIAAMYCAGQLAATFIEQPLKNPSTAIWMCYTPNAALEFMTY